MPPGQHTIFYTHTFQLAKLYRAGQTSCPWLQEDFGLLRVLWYVLAYIFEKDIELIWAPSRVQDPDSYVKCKACQSKLRCWLGIVEGEMNKHAIERWSKMSVDTSTQKKKAANQHEVQVLPSFEQAVENLFWVKWVLMMLTELCGLRSRFIRIHCFCVFIPIKHHVSSEIQDAVDVNEAAVNMAVQIPFQNVISFLLGVYSEVGLLDALPCLLQRYLQ